MGIVRKVFRPEEIKEVSEKDYLFEAIISTESKDRHGEIVKAEGIDITNYMKHPVLLSSHRYDDLRKQIGIVKEMRKEGNKWVAKIQYFAGEGNEEADWGYKLAKKGVAAFSIGFIPKDYEDGDGEVKRIYTKSELLEISQVLVPANPEALMKSIEEGDEIEKEIAETIRDEIEKAETWAITGDRDLPLSDERSWDGDRARQEIRRWASSDGSGNKEKIDWRKFGKGFVVGKRGSDNFGDYKLPFARVMNGRLTATLGGVIFAMAAVLGARGGVDIPEEVRKRAYNFLAHYYRRFGKEPPQYRSIENIEEWIEKELLEFEIINLKKLLLHMEARLEDISLQLRELAYAKAHDSSTSGYKPEGVEEGIDHEALLREIEELRKTLGGK